MRSVLAGLLMASVLVSGSQSQQTTQRGSNLSLVLVLDDGTRASAVVPVAGTLIVTRNDAGSGGASANEPPNKLDLELDVSAWSNAELLHWLSQSASRSGAVFTVRLTNGVRVEFTLTGIRSRNMTMTEQGELGQASFILGAMHVSVGGLALN